MSFYTIVQYVPDPIADERINIGVIALEGDIIRGRFLRTWARIRHFGGEDVHFLRDFAQRVSEWTPAVRTLPGFDTSIHLDAEGLRHICGRWVNSLQFTELRASVLTLDELLEETARKFLRETARSQIAYRDRRFAARLAYSRLENAMRRHLGDRTREVVQRNSLIDGRLDVHRFDVALTNGQVNLAAHGLSFEGPASDKLEKEIDATAWAIDDVRSANATIPLTVVAIPPRTSKSKTYDRAVRIFEGLRADVVEESDVEGWADSVANAAGRIG